MFAFSANSEAFENEVLKKNLISILDINYNEPVETDSEVALKPDLRDRVNKIKEGVFKKRDDARHKRKNIGQVKTMLPIFLSNPKSLIGKSVLHKCLENGEVEWHQVKVVSIAKFQKDPMKIEYNNVPHDTYYVPLLVDLKKGDLVVVGVIDIFLANQSSLVHSHIRINQEQLFCEI